MGVRRAVVIALVVSLTACGGGGSAGSPNFSAMPPAAGSAANSNPATATTLYIENLSAPSQSIDVFSAAGSGSEPQLGSISTAHAVYTIVTDPQGDIYGSETPDHIVEYAPGSIGSVTPIRDIGGPNTRLNMIYVHDFTVAADGTVAALSEQSVNGCLGPWEIDVFAPGANGNVAPARTITGSSTGLFQGSLAMDAADNIYLAILTRNSILVFDPSKNGNAAPTRTISGSSTQLDEPIDVVVAPDERLAVLNQNNGATWAVTQYPIAGSGNVAPSAAITGSNNVSALAVDNAGYFYVWNSGMVNVYAPGASGAAAPVRSIVPQGFSGTYDIAVH